MANPRLPRWVEDPPDPVEAEMARRGRRKAFVGFLVVLFLAMFV